MGFRVDLAAEHFLRARDRDFGDLAAQLFARAIHRHVDLGPRAFELPAPLGFAVGLRLVDDAARARLRLVYDAARDVARARYDLVGFGRALA